jgi:O-6-methylguanine DNA methyltransferase
MSEWTDAEVAPGVTVRIVACAEGLQAIRFGAEAGAGDGARNGRNALLEEAARQLRAYFAGEARAFDLQLDMRGTEFQKRVWRELLKIRYGETRGYGETAAAMGAPKAVRAVGAANGANPLPIVVPCHRVIGAGGKLVGYGGGLELKRRLLELENPTLISGMTPR